MGIAMIATRNAERTSIGRIFGGRWRRMWARKEETECDGLVEWYQSTGLLGF